MTSMQYYGYENPEENYQVLSNMPVVYTGAWQMRQFGAGDASTHRVGANVLSALANPPANMVTAQENTAAYFGGISLDNGNGAADIANYPVTGNDKTRYFPAT